MRSGLTAAVAALAVAAALVSGCGSAGDSNGPDTTTTSLAPAPPKAEISPAADCDRYASPGGSDATGNGSLQRPWASVDRLVKGLSDRDGGRVGCLRGGDYTPAAIDPAGGEPELRIDRPDITLTSYPGERARVIGRVYIADTGDGVTVSNLDLSGRSSSYFGSTCSGECGNASFPIAGSGVTVSGNDITNDRTDICIQLINNGFGQADDTTITGNRIHDCGELAPKRSNTAHAIYVNHASGARIARNVITSNGAFGVKLGPQAVGATVEHNVIDSNGVGVLMGDQPPCPSTADATHDNTIAANVVTRSQVRGNIEGFWYPSADDASCFDIGDDTRGNLVSGNCLYADGPDSFYLSDAGLRGRSEDIPESGGFEDDGTNLTSIPSARDPMPPIYVDPLNGNFHLQSVSGDDNDCLELSGIDDGAATANVRRTAAENLSPASPGTDPAVAIRPDGGAAAVWIQDAAGESSVQVIAQDSGSQTGPGRWDASNPSVDRPAPEALSTTGDASAPAVALGGDHDDGIAIAVWRSAGPTGVAVYASVRRGGKWADAAPLSAPGRSVGEPQVAAAPDGGAIVAWSIGGSVVARTLTPGANRFASAVTLDDAGGDPRVAAVDGGSLAIWESDGHQVRTAAWDGSAWSDPVTLSSGGPADAPAIAAGPDGAVAAWRQAGTGAVAAVSPLPAVSWGDAKPLSPSVAAGPPSAAMGPGGPLVTWRSGEGADSAIMLASANGTGALSSVRALASASAEDAPSVVAASGGSALVTWGEGDSVLAAYRSAGRAWGDPETLTGPGGRLYGTPAAAIGPSGAAAVVWAEAGPEGIGIRTADFYP